MIGGIFHFFYRYIHRKNPLSAATIGNRPDRFDDWFGAG